MVALQVGAMASEGVMLVMSECKMAVRKAGMWLTFGSAKPDIKRQRTTSQATKLMSRNNTVEDDDSEEDASIENLEVEPAV